MKLIVALVLGIIFASAVSIYALDLPGARIKTYFGFENNTFDEVNYQSENASIVAMPSIYDGENYAVLLASNNNQPNYIVSMARPHDNDMIFGFYFMVDNPNPNPAILLFGARDNSDYHFQVVLYQSRLYLLNSDYEIMEMTEPIINRNRWIRLESRLRMGNIGEVDILIDGVLVLSTDMINYNGEGHSGATEMYIGGQAIDTTRVSVIPPSKSNVYVSSGYYLGHATSNADVLGNFSIVHGDGLIDI